MKIPLKLMEEIEYVETGRNIASVEDPIWLSILSDYYDREIELIERASEKKSFICKSWKIKFVSHQPAFMKIDIGAKPEKLLPQEMIFQSKIFERGEGVLPLWTTTNNHLVLSIRGPDQTLSLALNDYLENRGKLEKEDFLNLARLLARLHLKGRELFSEIFPSSERGDSRDFVLSHGDLTRENILLDKNKKIWLADWENLRADWPEYDLAYFIRDGMHTYGLKVDDPIHKLFLRAYEKHSGFKINYDRLRKYLESFKENKIL